MTHGHILFRIGVTALLATLAACGSQSVKSPGNTRGVPADALLADALQREPEKALPLVKEATEKAPERPDIAWLYSQLCSQVAGCRPESAESRLRRLDPGNAAAWLGALERAREARDVAAENEVLDAMSRGQRFDIYWNPLVSRIAVAKSSTPAAQTLPVTDVLTTYLNDTVTWISGTALPSFAPLGDACSTARMGNLATAERCRAIADLLMRGDSYIAESVGLGIAERLARPGSTEAAAVASQIRRSRYQRETAGQVIAAQVEHDKISRELIELMTQLRREQDVFLAVIRWSGQPIEPG
ncbi:MAG TPA: hypothetical protein VIT67_01270 [Povalibacter sp.]